MNELQGIVDRLRGPQNDGRFDQAQQAIDVDDLVTDVTRAKELLDYCQGKIQRADVQIRSVIEDLKPVDNVQPPEAGPLQQPYPFVFQPPDAPTEEGIPF
jgi:hypothetical protein